MFKTATSFGAPAATGFGAPAAAAFGAPAATGFGGFGAPAATGFGAPAATGFGAPAATGFGAPAATGFGAPAATGFGAPAATGFGAPAATGFAGFGAPAAATGFGTPAAATGFGAPSMTGFGGFGVPASSAGASSGFGFGGFGGDNSVAAQPAALQPGMSQLPGGDRVLEIQLSYAALLDNQTGLPAPRTATDRPQVPNETMCKFDSIMYNLKSDGNSKPQMNTGSRWEQVRERCIFFHRFHPMSPSPSPSLSTLSPSSTLSHLFISYLIVRERERCTYCFIQCTNIDNKCSAVSSASSLLLF